MQLDLPTGGRELYLIARRRSMKNLLQHLTPTISCIKRMLDHGDDLLTVLEPNQPLRQVGI